MTPRSLPLGGALTISALATFTLGLAGCGAMSAQNPSSALKIAPDARVMQMIDAKLYIFGGQSSMDAFLIDERTNLAFARTYWAEEVQGGNSFVRRAKRLELRVPHDKSGEELARAVAVAKAGKP